MELCKHPLFGPHVREVVLDSFRFNELLVHKTGHKLNTSIFTRDLTGIREVREDMNIYLGYLEEEYELERSGKAIELLTEASCSPCLHDKPINISLPGGSIRSLEKIITRTSLRPIDYLTASDIFRRREKVQEHGWDYVLNHVTLAFALMMMLEAVVKSGCKISSLHLEVPDSAWRNVNIEPSAIQVVSKALTALKEIRLDLNEGPLMIGLDSVFQATLPHAESLEKLYLRVADERLSWHEGSCVFFLDSTTCILDSITSNSLFHVQLEDTPIRATDLLKFLEKHKHTLRELALLKIALIGEWGDILVWIEENLHFEKFCITLMHTMDETPSNGEWIRAWTWFRGGFGASGRDEVHLETKRFLVYLRRWCTDDKDIDREEYELDWSGHWDIRAEFMGAGFMDES